ncbi:Zn-dependent hydrolase [Nonomuraea insulae]|uniref:Zn-dependent hydrolase n=1 Tax=Nonomuraea insulae TaxID=1616787 RepID=A0ABW1D7U3_9ACTN
MRPTDASTGAPASGQITSDSSARRTVYGKEPRGIGVSEDAHAATLDITTTPLRVNAARLLTALRDLARFGADPNGGITRLGLSTQEAQAREFLKSLGARAGLTTEIDPAGNLLIRRPNADPDLPVLMFGSHVDTVRQGGWLDGAYGVVAAVEALTVLVEAGIAINRFEPVAVGFANEEGALVQYPFWGSRAIAGLLDADSEKATDREGRPARDYLLSIGGDPARLAEAAWPAGRIAAFLELHIEQGPVLEQLGLDIGVVDGIVGRTIFACEVSGEQQHAGTTPMPQRRDALVSAAQLVTKVESLATELGACSTATVGFMDVLPNTVNTIPGVVHINAEIRDTDPARIWLGERLLASMTEHVAQASGVEINLRVGDRSTPVLTDTGLQTVIVNATEALDLSWQAMPSGAGHDAQIIAALAPIGMIFVPSKGGVSHSPGEDTDAQALVSGADVLVTTLAALLGGRSVERFNTLASGAARSVLISCHGHDGQWIDRVLSHRPYWTVQSLMAAVHEGIVGQARRQPSASAPESEHEPTREELARIACRQLEGWLVR